MKATGIVRRIDDLGRIVIPKEIRRTLRIREGDPLEIFMDNNGSVTFKKYTYFGDFDYKKALNILKPILEDKVFAIYNNYCDYVCSTYKANFADEMCLNPELLPDNCTEVRVGGDIVAYLYIKGEVREQLKNACIKVLKEFFTESGGY